MKQAFLLKPKEYVERESSSIGLHNAKNLLREAIPYLTKVEMGPSTSIVLRSLIKDIESVVNHAGRS